MSIVDTATEQCVGMIVAALLSIEGVRWSNLLSTHTAARRFAASCGGLRRPVASCGFQADPSTDVRRCSVCNSGSHLCSTAMIPRHTASRSRPAYYGRPA